MKERREEERERRKAEPNCERKGNSKVEAEW